MPKTMRERLSLKPLDAALFVVYITMATFLGLSTLRNQDSVNSITDSYRKLSSDNQAQADQLYIKGDDFRRLARFETDVFSKLDLEYTGQVDHLWANYHRNAAAIWENGARETEESMNLPFAFSGLIYGLTGIGSAYHLRSFLRS